MFLLFTKLTIFPLLLSKIGLNLNIIQPLINANLQSMHWIGGNDVRRNFNSGAKPLEGFLNLSGLSIAIHL